MYRFAAMDPANPTVLSNMIYPEVVQPSFLRFQTNTAYSAENGSTSLIRITANDKAHYQNFAMPASPDYQHDAVMTDGCTTGHCAYGNGTVAGIQELCLGSYE